MQAGRLFRQGLMGLQKSYRTSQGGSSLLGRKVILAASFAVAAISSESPANARRRRSPSPRRRRRRRVRRRDNSGPSYPGAKMNVVVNVYNGADQDDGGRRRSGRRDYLDDYDEEDYEDAYDEDDYDEPVYRRRRRRSPSPRRPSRRSRFEEEDDYYQPPRRQPAPIPTPVAPVVQYEDDGEDDDDDDDDDEEEYIIQRPAPTYAAPTYAAPVQQAPVQYEPRRSEPQPEPDNFHKSLASEFSTALTRPSPCGELWYDFKVLLKVTPLSDVQSTQTVLGSFMKYEKCCQTNKEDEEEYWNKVSDFAQIKLARAAEIAELSS